jgi:hypothetical protein
MLRDTYFQIVNRLSLLALSLLTCRARKHVGNAAADDRSDDAEHDNLKMRG